MPDPSFAGRHTPLYAAVTARLSPAEVLLCEEMFEGLETEAEGHRYRIGPIIRAAWQTEQSLPAAAAQEIAELLRAVFDATVSRYTVPACCRWHRLTIPAAFAATESRPPNEELLDQLSKLIWVLLPHWRAVLPMNYSPRRTQYASRFMLFESLVKWHDREVLVGGRDQDDAVRDYAKTFSPSRHAALRRADLRKRLDVGEICGMIGARNDNTGIGLPHYCDQRWRFSTPGQADGKARLGPPDRQLSRLGLDFERDQFWVELVYPVEIGPRRLAGPRGAALPSIVDAAGYWLFRPDRATGRDGLRWNHTRDLVTNQRGHRELIAKPAPMSELFDLIVWPVPTLDNWVTAAAPALAADNLI